MPFRNQADKDTGIDILQDPNLELGVHSEYEILNNWTAFEERKLVPVCALGHLHDAIVGRPTMEAHQDMTKSCGVELGFTKNEVALVVTANDLNWPVTSTEERRDRVLKVIKDLPVRRDLS